MISKILIKAKSVFIQNLSAFLIVIFWFIINYIIFFIQTIDPIDSLFILFYFREPKTSLELFYSSFTEFLIFGLVFSLITIELFRKYNPTETCRQLARTIKDHSVIIGYNHIGRRIANCLQERGKKVVIVEKKKKLVHELIECECAVVNDDALNMETLRDAGVNNAKAVYVMSDNLEIQFVVNSNIRQLNKSCKLFCRIFEDDIAEVIAKTYNATIISTSKYTADVLIEKIQKKGYSNILLIGINHISVRLIIEIKKIPNVKLMIIEEDEEILELMNIPKSSVILGDPKDTSNLEKVDIKNIDFIFNSDRDPTNSILITKRIRELNQNCKVYSRFFQDSVADVLEQPPFNSKVISSSKYALKLMSRKGMLEF